MDAPDQIPVTRFPLQQNRRYGDFSVHGFHHGLAILLDRKSAEAIVWDPLTGHDHLIPLPPRFGRYQNGYVKNAAVFCAATEDGHVHGDCIMNPFKVVLMCDDYDKDHALCCLYESVSGVWGNTISLATTDRICDTRPGVIAGNSVFWLLDGGRILELDLERRSLVVIEKPSNVHFTGFDYFQILWTPDSGLCLMIFLKSSQRIPLWGRKSKNEGVVGWVLQKTIEVNGLLPLVSQKDRKKTYILGYDSDSNTIVLSTTTGALVVQLDTLEFRSIPKRRHSTYYPYRNFYTTGNTLHIHHTPSVILLYVTCSQNQLIITFLMFSKVG
jgi:hypothetical protein